MKLIKIPQCCDQDGYPDCPYAAYEGVKDKHYCDHPEIDAFTLEALEEGIPDHCPLEDAE
jgi:hypothetical protein